MAAGGSGTIDPITLEVIQESLITIVREMRANLIATAYSSVIHEAHDFSCVLVDAEGQIVAMAEDNPSHIFPIPWSVKAMREKFGDDINPGDVFLHNDPYTGGTHLNDIAMIYPVFIDGSLALFPVVRAHWSDVGGTTPGSISGKNTEIFHDGVRIPIIRIVKDGKVEQSAMDLLLANMRIPRERRGDFMSTLGTCRIAENRLVELAAKYGLQTIRDAIVSLLDRADLRMRKAISALPDGVYTYEHFLDPARLGAEPIRTSVTLTIEGDRMLLDFEGSSPQTPASFNSGQAVAQTGAFIVLKAFLDQESPINHGNFRAIETRVPEGSFLNAQYPASCAGASEVRNAATSAMLGVMNQVMPELASGDIKGTANHVYIGGSDRDGEPFLFYEYPAAGTGGSPIGDGSNALRNFSEGDFSSIQPVEAIEQEAPLLVERTELRVDSCGAGLARGGFGMRRDVRLLADRGVLSISSTKSLLPPFGVDGGLAGGPNEFFVIRDGEEVSPSETPGKVSGFPLLSGDVVSIRTSGGGGWGDPLARDPESVAVDVRCGLLTSAAARRLFGVIADGGIVDQPATDAERRGKATARERFTIAFEPEPPASGERRYGHVSPTALVRMGLSDGTCIELCAEHGSALRVWVRGSPDIPDDTIRVGERVGAILRAAEGSRIYVRGL